MARSAGRAISSAERQLASASDGKPTTAMTTSVPTSRIVMPRGEDDALLDAEASDTRQHDEQPDREDWTGRTDQGADVAGEGQRDDAAGDRCL